MKILSWNVRGLGRLRMVNRLKNKLRAINPRILFLIETKLSAKKMEMVRLKCGFENGIDIGVMGSRGGLSLGWKGNSLISLKSFSSFHIDVEVQDKECGTKWRLTWFYENPDERGRRDFNEITNSFEKKKGRCRSERQMMVFRTVLEDCNLNDLGEDISDDNLAEIVEIQLWLNLEADKEELFWEQRARVNWLKNGDHNTSFFYKMAGQCRFRGRISDLEDESGTRITAEEEMSHRKYE
ncbi:reverse transcriptase [Gossypium australe]|uniref:Reverse transcriptase n=1 Tax=Gossypium australe TaxID=47621 RepID=A0A5B6X5N9_9ROSI|nr:reverse transcriptase [Gossypium australe]